MHSLPNLLQALVTVLARPACDPSRPSEASVTKVPESFKNNGLQGTPDYTGAARSSKRPLLSRHTDLDLSLRRFCAARFEMHAMYPRWRCCSFVPQQAALQDGRCPQIIAHGLWGKASPKLNDKQMLLFWEKQLAGAEHCQVVCFQAMSFTSIPTCTGSSSLTYLPLLFGEAWIE